MTAHETALLLMETTLASTAAIVLVLALRHPVRYAFGVGAAYALWATVPLMSLSMLMPASMVPMLPSFATTVSAWEPEVQTVVAQAQNNRFWVRLPWLWGFGGMCMLATLMWQQARFISSLGPLHQRPDGHYQSVAIHGLPAVVGWKPHIVLPFDFEQRYTHVERELVLAHEREHLRRHDLPACLLVVIWRSLFWFNPLMHLAARQFRHDQELACDAGVLRRFPERRRSYAEAMLKTQLADRPLPFGCHWFATHPLKERIVMLTRPVPSRPRRLTGLIAVAALAVGGATLAWASQSTHPVQALPGMLLLEMEIKLDDEDARDLSVVIAPDETHEERFVHAGQNWHTRWTVSPLTDGSYDVRIVLERDGEVVSTPRLVVRDSGAIRVGAENEDGIWNGYAIEMRIGAGPSAPNQRARRDPAELP